MSNTNSIGEAIKAARKKCGLTQEQLAELLHTTKTTVSRYESGARRPNLLVLEALYNITGVRVGEITSGTDFWKTLPSYEGSASFAKDPRAALAASLFSMLNEDGQQRAIEYLEMLNDSEKYKRLEK